MKSVLRNRYITGLVSLLVLVGAILLFFRFYASMKTRELRVLDARDRLASFEQYKRIFAEEAIRFEAIKARIAILEKGIVAENDIPSVLSSLEEMAKARGIDFSITLVESSTRDATPKLRIDFSATGSFSAIEALVGEFLSQQYQVRFNRFSLYQGEAVVAATGATAPAAPMGTSWQLLASMDVLSF